MLVMALVLLPVTLPVPDVMALPLLTAVITGAVAVKSVLTTCVCVGASLPAASTTLAV